MNITKKNNFFLILNELLTVSHFCGLFFSVSPTIPTDIPTISINNSVKNIFPSKMKLQTNDKKQRTVDFNKN